MTSVDKKITVTYHLKRFCILSEVKFYFLANLETAIATKATKMAVIKNMHINMKRGN